MLPPLDKLRSRSQNLGDSGIPALQCNLDAGVPLADLLRFRVFVGAEGIVHADDFGECQNPAIFSVPVDDIRLA
jgi:hypothetical protein